MSAAVTKALARLASGGAAEVSQFVAKNIGKANLSGTDKKVLDIIMDSFAPKANKLVRPDLPNTSPSALRDELTGFLDKEMARQGDGALRLTTKQLPSSIRNMGLQAPDEFDFRTGKWIGKDPSKKTLSTMRDNIEVIADMGGNPNFYYDKYGILRRMTPELDPMYSSLLSSPFSMGSNPVDELYRFGQFVENPTRYVPAGVAGAQPQGKALTIMTRENPTIFDLTKKGNVGKIGSYAENSGDPYNSLRATIDTHAFKLPSGMPHGGELDLTDSQYRVFEKLYQDVAAGRGMMPHEVQSATWDAWRRLMHKDTGAMLNPQDFGRVSLSPLFGLEADARSKALLKMLEDNPQLRSQIY